MRSLKQLLAALLLCSTLTFTSSAQPRVGQKAPDFEATTPEGATFTLSQYKGKVVIVDFWASWCGPCRAGHPTLTNCYTQYADKVGKKGDGLVIISISLDVSKKMWESAIKADRLTWTTHGCDFGGFRSALAKKYGVTSIPSNYIIDKRGVIIAKNLRGQELESYLKEIFDKP